jgi:molybdopterin-biosynthesis enzyme MoeA-like protein
MHAIFEGAVLPRLKEMLGPAVYLEEGIKTGVGDESVLGGFVDRVMKQVPGVYLKSKPTRFDKDVELEVIVTAAGPKKGEVQKRIKEAKKLLLELIKALPIRTGG